MLVMFHVCLYYTILSVPCSLVFTCWESTDIVSLVCDVSLCFCHFLYGVSVQVWYLVVSIPDLSTLIHLFRLFNLT